MPWQTISLSLSEKHFELSIAGIASDVHEQLCADTHLQQKTITGHREQYWSPSSPWHGPVVSPFKGVRDTFFFTILYRFGNCFSRQLGSKKTKNTLLKTSKALLNIRWVRFRGLLLLTNQYGWCTFFVGISKDWHRSNNYCEHVQLSKKSKT